MSNRPKWLTSEPLEFGGSEEAVYDLAAIKEQYEVRELITGECWLVLKDAPYEEGVKYSGWLEFALLQFCCSNVDGTNTKCSITFHGGGPSGTLREPRHTYWGEEGDGYLFYPRASNISAGLVALREFFDFH